MGGNIAELGGSLSVSAGKVLAGAPMYSLEETGRSIGAAFIFEKTGAAWTATRLLGSLPAGSNFGNTVAIRGDTALIGEPGGVGSGRVYSFARSSAGYWGEVQRLEMPGVPNNGHFGARIDMDADHAIVTENDFFNRTPRVSVIQGVTTTAAGIQLEFPSTVASTCAAFPRTAIIRWRSDAVSCRAVDQGTPKPYSWTGASCTHPDSCQDPRDFRLLAPQGEVLITVTNSTDSAYFDSFSIECTADSGVKSRATSSLKLLTRFLTDCPAVAPVHTLTTALSQAPVALANGNFEMRAQVTNPQSAELAAIARQVGPGSRHARMQGNELMMVFAPAANETRSNPVIQSSFGVAVATAGSAVERNYSFTVDLSLNRSGFE